jgi:signal transduction histidine kinase
VTIVLIVLAVSVVVWVSVQADRQEARNLAELERSNRELDEFATIASHDLMTPLRSIAGLVQVLERRHGEQLGPDGASLIDGTVAATRQMEGMLDALLGYSRAGRGDVRRERVDSRAVVSDLVRGLDDDLRAADVQVELGPLPEVQADRALLAQLLQNLVVNAVRHGGRHVRVEALRDGAATTFVVADDGPGVPTEDRERIFGMFSRGSGGAADGSGVGLAICRRIVDRHGGRIWVAESPRGGAAFLFTLGDDGSDGR